MKLSSRCVVLDIDDTLYLERNYVQSGFTAVDAWLERAQNVSGFLATAWALFEGGYRGDIFDRALTGLSVDFSANLIAEMITVYREHLPNIALTPDAHRFLTRANGESRLAVVSDGPLNSQSAKAGALGLSRWADPIVLTAAYGRDFHKPSQGAFRLVMERFDVGGKDCCYVADNPRKDFVGPKSLGWRTVRIRREGGLHFDVQGGSDIDTEISTLDELALS